MKRVSSSLQLKEWKGSKNDEVHQIDHLQQLVPLSSSLDEETAGHLCDQQSECSVDDEKVDLENDELKWILGHLAHWNLEEYMGEVAFNIFSADFQQVRKEGGIHNWTVAEAKSWIESLSFLGPKRADIAQKMENECIDGDSFTILCQERRLGDVLGVDYIGSTILELIVTSWKDISSEYILSSSIPHHLLGVMSGYISDLSSLSSETARKMIHTNKACISSGVGSIYGQLVVLGYTEYRMVEDKWYSFGHPNLKFQLVRRKLPNGVKPMSSTADSTILMPSSCSAKKISAIHSPYRINFNCTNKDDTTSSQVISYQYVTDPLKDMYQIGRAAYSSNDFVVPGELHYGADSLPSGPVSRRACRIECERLPPFRCYIYAGGFSETQEISVRGDYMKTSHGTELDGFTTFGIKLLQPEIGVWQEVSVLGHVYEPRAESFALPTKRLSHWLQNRLTNGSLIDIGGVILMYQDAISIAQVSPVQSEQIIQQLNGLRPHCPVMFSNITFSFLESYQKAQRAMSQGCKDHMFSFAGCGPIHIPKVDLNHVPEDQRAYVFPACGHVFAYHTSLENMKSCPLCRQTGSFVPIAFAFDSSLDDSFPTHIFNPCGHAASEETVKYWSTICVFNRHLPFQRLYSICPFCATELHGERPYSKLVIETELPVESAVEQYNLKQIAAIAEQIEESSIWVFPFNREDISVDSEEFVEEVIAAQQEIFKQRYGGLGESSSHRNSFQAIMRRISSQGLVQISPIDEFESLEGYAERFLSFPTFAPQLL